MPGAATEAVEARYTAADQVVTGLLQCWLQQVRDTGRTTSSSSAARAA